MKTLPREPYRGGQVCGYQTNVGGWSEGQPAYCGEPKAHGLYACAQHDRDMYEEYGDVRMAPGNARGDRAQAVTLQWEPYEGSAAPIAAMAEEIEEYERG